MAKTKTSKKPEREELEEIVTDVCVAFGYALRHTSINHHTKSKKGWEAFAKQVMRLVDAQN